MLRNGNASTDPPWMILMFPPCSTTKSRPELSFGCSTSKGELKPVAITWVLTAVTAGELLPIPPHPSASAQTSAKVRLARNRRIDNKHLGCKLSDDSSDQR